MSDIGQIITNEEGAMAIDDRPNHGQMGFSFMRFTDKLSRMNANLKPYLIIPSSCKPARVMIVLLVIVSIILLALIADMNGRMFKIHDFFTKIEEQGKGNHFEVYCILSKGILKCKILVWL